MAWEDPGQIVPLKAGATIAANTLVYMTADQTVSKTSGPTNCAMGVAKQAAASGTAVPVQVNGVSKILVGTAAGITFGSPLMAQANGAVALWVTAAGANFIIGYAWEASTIDGQYISVLLATPATARA